MRASNTESPNGEWSSSSQSFSTSSSSQVIAANGVLTHATGSTATLSAKIASFGTGLLSRETTLPNEVTGLKAWFDGYSAAFASTSTTSNTAPANNGDVHKWIDRSGNGYHAIKETGVPKWIDNGFNGKGTIDLTNDSLNLTNSASDFDGWSDLTIFTTLYQTGYQDFSIILGKGNAHGWTDNNSNSFAWLLNMHRSIWGDHRLWGPALNTSTGGNTYNHTTSDAIWSTGVNANFTGGPSVLTMRYSSTDASKNLIFKINGSVHKTANITGPLKSESSIPVSIGGRGDGTQTWKGRISELIIYNARIDDDGVEKMEAYLANKWGLTSKLPGNHYAQPVAGANISLYWGSTDGGSTLGSWANNLAIGKKNPKIAIWLDANDASTFSLSGNAITSWDNKVGTTHNFNQKSGDPSRLASGNGKSVVNFDGNDQLWTNDSYTKQNYTVLSVARYTGGQNMRIISSKDINWLHGFWNNETDVFHFNSWLHNGTKTYDTRWHLHAATQNNSDQGNTWTDFNQGVTDGGGSHDTTWWPGKFSLGAWSNLGESSKGEVAELIVVNEVLSVLDRQKLEAYLAHKWGLSSHMPNSHPYKSASPIVDPRDLESYTVDLSGLTPGNTYNYRVAATNSQGTDWADSTATFTSESAINLSSGTLVFNTSNSTPTWYASDGSGGNGVLETLSWTDSQSNTVQHKVAKFSFSQINIGDGVKVSLVGSNPIHLDVENNATILAKLDASATAQSTKSVLGGGLGGLMHDPVGWRNSRLFGDVDSGISSDFTYTTSINLHGSTRSVNGVSFTGTTASSGTGWSLSGFTSHIDGSHGSADSTATGDIGAILDDGFKYGGTEKLTISGLTDGKAYVLALYSQAWGGPRVSTITCSDLSETLTLDQDLYGGQTPDSQLTECVYIADGTEVEFTFSANNWHLYAFSNREASDGMSGSGPSHIIGANPYNSGGSRYKGGSLSGSGLVAGEAPGGGSYGGKGGRPELNGGTDSLGAHPISGQTYGNINVDALLAGSGGGAGSIAFGGTGGGAIKITAGGKLIIGKDIYANGGMGNSDSTNDAAKSGAGGSGGAVYLKASDLVINSGVSIRADGGPGAPLATGGNTGATDSGGTGSAAGGGGRVYLEGTNSFFNHGSLSNDNISANKGGEAKGISFPSGINGLELWLDAADSSTIFRSILIHQQQRSGWLERKSGNNNHATQSTLHQESQTYTINSLLNNQTTSSSSSSNWFRSGWHCQAFPAGDFLVAYYKMVQITFDDTCRYCSGPGSYGQYG